MSRPSAVRPAVVAIGLALLALGGIGCGSDSDTEAVRQSGAEPSQGPGAPDSAGLLARLRSGGLVVIFRHAATDPSDEDDADVDLEDCATQRNLTDEGRTDARSIGAAFRGFRIPVGAVWTSPYCRARDTAELAFGRHRVMNGLERLYPALDEAADRRMNRLIREHAPTPGDPNLVIAAHGVYPSVLGPAVTLAEGEAAIYDVGATRVRLLGRVAADQWGDLGSGRAPASNGGLSNGVARGAGRSVVSVEPPGGEQGGTGFRVAVDGIVVTSADAVGDADAATVTLNDGTRRPARVLGRAPRVDVAVLELDNDSGLPPMHSGSGLADARVGDPVLAVGAPAGPAGAATPATLEALRAPVRLGRDGELEALAIDATIQPAQAGGPLVNSRGEVLGLVTTAATPRARPGSTSTGFAIPVDIARSAALAIVEADSAFLGSRQGASA